MAYRHIRGSRNPMHEQRLALLAMPLEYRHPSVQIPADTLDTLSVISAIFFRAGKELLAEVDTLEKRDEGRITACIDKLRAAKSAVGDALVLPLAAAQPLDPRQERTAPQVVVPSKQE